MGYRFNPLTGQLDLVGSSSAAAAGTSGQIQYNSSGSLAAGTDMSYDATAHRVTVGATGPLSVTNDNVSLVTRGSIAAMGAYNENTATPGVYLGYADDPKVAFFNGTSSQNWQIDNQNGRFRWFTPLVEQMVLTQTDLTFPNPKNVSGVGTLSGSGLASMGAFIGSGDISGKPGYSFNAYGTSSSYGGDLGIALSNSSRGIVANGPNQSGGTTFVVSAVGTDLAYVYSSGSFKPLGGYQSSDGTAGSTATTSSGQYKDGLYVGAGTATNQVGVLATTTGINAKTVANTPVYTVPTGKTAIITGAVVRCTAASAVTAGPTVGFGNVSGTSNVLADAALTALTSTASVFGFSLVGMSVSTPAAGTLYLNLGAAATGTSQTIAADVMGYLI